MEEMNTKIGERLRKIRNHQKLTLDDVAKLTGVSKPMLGQIERGQSSPTINTLWKISTGLKMPLSILCRPQETELTVVKLGDKIPVVVENEGMRVYTLFPFDPIRNFEVYYMELDAGVKHISESHGRGVEEYIFVVEGSLKIMVHGEEVVLDERQSMRFASDEMHGYHNISDRVCTIHDMIFYPAN